jgi:ABC-2 type transport system permease protein
MTTTTLSPEAAPTVDAAAPVRRIARGRVTLRRVIYSEWIKLRSVRSTVLTILAAAGAIIALGLLFTGSSSGSIGPGVITGHSSTSDPISASLGGVDLAQLIIGVLGVILVTGEYATGVIRSSLASVPRRIPVLSAKAIVLGSATLVSMLVASFGAFLGGQALLGPAGESLAEAGALRAVIGAAVYLAGVSLLGLAAGAIFRGTAAAIGALFTVMYVVPGLFPLLPHSWNATIGPYLPSRAGMAFMHADQAAGSLGPWTGLAVFAAYVLAALAAAAVLLKRRDASP